MLVLKLHEMPWYLMSKSCQLDYAHTLNRLQNGAVLQIGPFGALNYEVFSNVMSSFQFQFDANFSLKITSTFR